MDFPEYDDNLSPLDNLQNLMQAMVDDSENDNPPIDERKKDVGDRVIIVDITYNRLKDKPKGEDEILIDTEDYRTMEHEGIVIGIEQDEQYYVDLASFYDYENNALVKARGVITLDILIKLKDGKEIYLPSSCIARLDKDEI